MPPSLDPAPSAGSTPTIYRRTQLLSRRLRVYAVAFWVKTNYKWADRKASKLPRATPTDSKTGSNEAKSEADEGPPVHPDYKSQEDAIWEDVHKRMAAFVFTHVLNLEGLWVKLGQFLGGRPDVVPAPWVEKLQQLQDRVPPKPVSDVVQSLREAYCGEAKQEATYATAEDAAAASSYTSILKTTKDVTSRDTVTGKSGYSFGPFAYLDPKPLATASIAQVHRATLVGGESVVAKVQHRGVAEIIEQDLENAIYLADELAKEKGGKYDFRAVLREYCSDVRKELDFRIEGETTDSVGENLRRGGFCEKTEVRVPSVIKETQTSSGSGKSQTYSVAPTKETLILSYVAGAKPTDEQQMEKIGLTPEKKEERSRVVSRITRAFAQQIFVDGVFSGDPHPGNIIVERILVDGEGRRVESGEVTSSSTVAKSNTMAKASSVATVTTVGPNDASESPRSSAEFSDSRSGSQSQNARSDVDLNDLDLKLIAENEPVPGPSEHCSASRGLVDPDAIRFTFPFVKSNINTDSDFSPHTVDFVPVLLDFGLVKVVPSDQLRLAFCRLVVAAHEQDISGLLSALREMGMGGGKLKDLSLGRPEHAMKVFQYMFRDAKPEESVEQQMKRRPQKGETAEEVEKNDEMDEDADILEDEEDEEGIARDAKKKSSKRSVYKADPAAGSGGIMSKGLSKFKSWFGGGGGEEGKMGGKTAEKPGSDEAAENEATNDVSDFAGLGTIFFLLRVVGLLRGLAVRLGVEHSYLETMAPIARQVLRDAYGKSEEAEASENSGPLKAFTVADPAQQQIAQNLLARLRKVGKSLQDRGLLLGASVCIINADSSSSTSKALHPLITLPIGERGVADPRPVDNHTLFCGFSCSKILPVLLIHVLIDKGYIASIDDPVSKYWPEFLANRSKSSQNQAITVRMLLEHRGGSSRAFPSRLGLLKSGPGGALRLLCNFDKMVAWIATAKPNEKEVGVAKYHAITHGWLLGGLAERVVGGGKVEKGQGYEDLVRKFVLEPLGLLHDANAVPVKTSISMEDDGRENSRVASLALHKTHVDKTKSDLFGTFTRRLRGRKASDSKEADTNEGKKKKDSQAPEADGDSDFESADENSDSKDKDKESAGKNSSSGPKKSTDSDPDAARGARLRRSLANTIGLDPRIFNDPTVRGGVIPAANTHFTSYGLAALFSSLLETDSPKLFSKAYLAKIHSHCLPIAADVKKSEETPWPWGFRAMRNENDDPVLASPGLVNNAGFADVRNGVAGAVLVNLLEFKQSQATEEILEVVGKELGVPKLPWKREMGLLKNSEVKETK